MDPRVRNLAKVLVNYSVKAQKGEIFPVKGPAAAEPLLLACYEELLRSGAFPIMQMSPNQASEVYFKHAQQHHFETITPVQKAEAEHMSGLISIRADINTRSLSAVDPQKMTAISKASQEIRKQIMVKRWVGTLFPTAAYAQDAEMSLSDFEDFVYAATFADTEDPIAEWKKVSAMQDRLIKQLEGADEVHITGPGTDLKFSIKDRTFINSDGVHNMPSGEIFTGPVETSAEGYITFDYPVCTAGREIDGVRLVFKGGEVVEASATKNEDYLLAVLDQDAGARRLGELGIGTNMMIQRFIKNILFDEKIGGSIHLALGNSIPGTGGTNVSALHWDLIKDLRKGGAMYVNGKLFQKDGKFQEDFTAL